MELLAELSERSARPAKPKVRKNCYHSLVFHHPYFRDINGMRAPMNEDDKIKRANKEMDPYLTPPLHWSAEENRMLVVTANSSIQLDKEDDRGIPEEDDRDTGNIPENVSMDQFLTIDADVIAHEDLTDEQITFFERRATALMLKGRLQTKLTDFFRK
ncbi:hypothetical protein MRX96_015814 [Rhipicephalus microplus]